MIIEKEAKGSWGTKGKGKWEAAEVAMAILCMKMLKYVLSDHL